MKPICIDCGDELERRGRRGPLPLRCLDCRRIEKCRGQRAYRKKSTEAYRLIRSARQKASTPEQLRTSAEWYIKKRKNNNRWRVENKERAKAWRRKNKEHIRQYRQQIASPITVASAQNAGGRA